MTVTLDDIRERESRHVLQTYMRQPVAFVPRRRFAALRRRRPRVSRFCVRHRRNFSWARASGPHGCDCGIRRRRCCTRRTCTTIRTRRRPRCGWRSSRACRARFFCNSGTEAVEACLKFARRYWYTQGATLRTGFVAVEGRIFRPHDGRAVGDAQRALSCALRPAHRTGDLRRSAQTRNPGGRGYRPHSGDHCRAHPGRRRHPSAVATVRSGHQRCLRADRCAVHRRRSADRPRSHRLSLLCASARPAA